MGTTSLYYSCKTLLNTEEVDENTFINVVRNLTYYIFRKLKKYIKTASCYPELFEKQEYTTIMNDFHESEKVFLKSKNVVTLICHRLFVQSFCILPVDQKLLTRCIFWCWLGRRRCRLPCSTPWGPCRPTSTTGARLPWSPGSRLPCLGSLCVSLQGRRPYLYGREGPIKQQGFPMFGLGMRWNDLLCPQT